jgi:radical SAM protein with 4Fe4S-binding SPASM domain
MELPRFVQIEPVGQCNLRCRMCPIRFREDGGPGQPPAFMAFADFCRIIDQFPRQAELHLQGLGEPLMHLYFFDMVRYAVERGMRVSTNTNLTILSAESAEECVRSGLHVLHVSLDAANPAIYEAIRVKAHFDKVLRNLRRLTKAKRHLESELPEIKLVCVVMRQNLDELPGLVKFARREGIRSLSVQHLCHDFTESTLPPRYGPMREFVDAQSLLQEDPARVERVFGDTRALAARLGIALRLPAVRPRGHAPGTPGRQRCDWPWRGAYVSYDGQAMPCCMVGTPDRASFGNMARDGVDAVWNNAAYEDFRERLDSDEPPEICRGCAIYRGTF